MSRLLPAPMASALVFLVWLLLNNTVDPAHLLLAAVLAVALPIATARLVPDRPRILDWGALLRLALVVFYDIVVANIEVARRILGPERAIRPRFVWVPLDLRDPHGILALAGMITMTPGTISSELSPDRRHLLVHALHVEGGEQGAADLVAGIKQRYEQPLIRIFDGGNTR
jgi:multicomponent K+:H+ antiporter subunit E